MGPLWASNHLGVAQNYTGGVTQVLVNVSTYQGSILEFRFFEPQPFSDGAQYLRVIFLFREPPKWRLSSWLPCKTNQKQGALKKHTPISSTLKSSVLKETPNIRLNTQVNRLKAPWLLNGVFSDPPIWRKRNHLTAIGRVLLLGFGKLTLRAGQSTSSQVGLLGSLSEWTG